MVRKPVESGAWNGPVHNLCITHAAGFSQGKRPMMNDVFEEKPDTMNSEPDAVENRKLWTKVWTDLRRAGNSRKLFQRTCMTAGSR